IPAPGIYLLAISGFDRDPASAAGSEIFSDTPFNVEHGPNGPGGGNPLAQWIGTGGSNGPYAVRLTGAAYSDAPCTPPQVVTHPEWQPTKLGNSATFQVVATGTPPLSYQWYHAGIEVAGATGPTLAINNASEADYGPY